MYAYILVAGTLGVLLAALFTVGERYALHWHESQRATAGYTRRTVAAPVAALSGRAGPRRGYGSRPCIPG
jgi:hypothetical protein